MKREIKFQIIYANQIDGYERLIEKDGNIFWQWMCLEMNPEKSERWISGVYPKQFEYIRRQFTGLHDKNGKEIYEGDIVRFNATYIKPKVVYWNNEMTGFYPLISERPNSLEIIGNIYENPDLCNT